MEIKFLWQGNTKSFQNSDLEHKIQADFDSGNLSFNFCHPQPILLSIDSPDPLSNTLIGNIKCSCGIVIATIKGASDGSSLTFSKAQ